MKVNGKIINSMVMERKPIKMVISSAGIGMRVKYMVMENIIINKVLFM